jgi:hypothetical protein
MNPNDLPDSYNNDQSGNPFARQQGGGNYGNQNQFGGGGNWNSPQPNYNPSNNWGGPQPNNYTPTQPTWVQPNQPQNNWGQPQPQPSPAPYTGDGWDLSPNVGGAEPSGRSVQTQLGLVKIVPRSLNPPPGWRALTFSEGQQLKSQLEQVLDEWSIVAFDHGKITGPGYGLTIEDSVGSECGEKFIVRR